MKSLMFLWSFWQFSVLACRFAYLLFQAEELKEMMHLAIVNNRLSFVRLFMENGVNLKEFLTKVRFTLHVIHYIQVRCNDHDKTAFRIGYCYIRWLLE